MGFLDDSRAMRIFDAILASDADDKKKAEALFGRAFLYEHRRPGEDFSAARKTYLEVADRFPDSPLAARALVARGRCYEIERDNEDVAKAREAYEGAARRFPASEAAAEAKLRLAMTYALKMQPAPSREGATRLAAWLAEYPEHPYATGVWIVLGRTCLDVLDEPERALKAFIAADRLGIKSASLRSDVYYRIAWIAHKAIDKPETARKYYGKIINEFENDPRAYLAGLELKKLGVKSP